MINVILASSSPRRAFLLSASGLKFKTINPKINENIKEVRPVQLVKKLALLKSEQVRAKIKTSSIIIGADTVVVIGKKIMGCPKNLKVAKDYLRKLSGKTHSVYTGVAIVIGKKKIVFSDKTLVTFNKLSESLLDYYLKNYFVLDKAGGYGIQEGGILLIRKINGSFSNVMGLPLDKVLSAIAPYLTN